uniref:Uncharacterized protein n=1 Tax=Tanacetum cinerariifolium TaxID=118510 RepID=A0A6L2NNX3_TANCI|nr:hypothetical protein [Tanacetum cinerariifolium]
MIAAQVGDLSSYTSKYSSPALTQKIFANMRRVGKGFSRVNTPLFKGMIMPQQDADNVDDVDADAAAEDEHAVSPTPPLSPHQSPIAQPSSPPQQQQPSPTSQPTTISMELLNTLLETYEDVTLEEVDAAKDAEVAKDADVQGRQKESQAQVYHIDTEHADKVLSMQDDEPEPAKLKEVIEVVTTVKLMIEVVTDAATTITAAPITATPSAAGRRPRDVMADC